MSKKSLPSEVEQIEELKELMQDTQIEVNNMLNQRTGENTEVKPLDLSNLTVVELALNYQYLRKLIERLEKLS